MKIAKTLIGRDMRIPVGLFLSGYLVAMVAFNNCSAVHEGGSLASSFEACNLALKDEFANGYHQFLVSNCANCHVSQGSGNGAFADSNLDIAFDAFNVRGNLLVGSRAIDPNHQPPWSGSQHSDEVSSLDNTWNVIKQQADDCVSRAGGAVDDIYFDGIVPEDPTFTRGEIETFVKLMNATATRKTLTWNLETEIKSPTGLSFAGAQLSIDVQANTTINGEKSYIFSNPRLRAGTQSIHLIHISFNINNELVSSATSYHGINRRVPATETRDLSVGSITFLYDLKNTDTVSLSIGLLDVVDFDPPTFAELIAPTGVFGQNCLSCHNAADTASTLQGNFDISTRQAVITQIKVAPYSPNNSRLFIRMNDAQSPMPTSGVLPNNQIKQVLDWIRDGAP